MDVLKEIEDQGIKLLGEMTGHPRRLSEDSLLIWPGIKKKVLRSLRSED